MEEFELKLRISPSDSLFRKKVGAQIYDKIKQETFSRDGFSCKGCGFHPLDESKVNTALLPHVLEINEEKPEESKCLTLCKACHSTQHIDVALEKEWVQLVNSTYSQKSLIEICRINAVHRSISEENTRHLKISAQEFTEKFKAGLVIVETKAKVIFTSKFEWDDL